MNIIELPFDNELTQDGNGPRYTVDFSVLEENNRTKKYYLVLDNGAPAKVVNMSLITQQRRRNRSVSTDAYHLAYFLNVLAADGVELKDVTLGYIESFLVRLYTYGKENAESKNDISTELKNDGCSAGVVRAYVRVIGDLFEEMALHGMPVHKSLLCYPQNSVIVANKKGRLTKVSLLKKKFPDKRRSILERSSAYTKWYTGEQVEAISNELPLVDRCIFLDSVFTGHRIDSSLSIMLQDFNPKEKSIYAGRTKTHKTHVAPLPDHLVALIAHYISDERSIVVERTGSASPYLFLSRDGSPRTYAAYYSTLKRAEQRLKKSRPDLGIVSLHPHAGRSTFLANLRTFQLEQQRLGKPTFSDADILTLMDWRSMQSLEDYDLLTRSFEVLPFQKAFFRQHYKYYLETKHNG